MRSDKWMTDRQINSVTILPYLHMNANLFDSHVIHKCFTTSQTTYAQIKLGNGTIVLMLDMCIE